MNDWLTDLLTDFWISGQAAIFIWCNIQYSLQLSCQFVNVWKSHGWSRFSSFLQNNWKFVQDEPQLPAKHRVPLVGGARRGGGEGGQGDRGGGGAHWLLPWPQVFYCSVLVLHLYCTCNAHVMHLHLEYSSTEQPLYLYWACSVLLMSLQHTFTEPLVLK